jgi:hypothetical protein
MGMIMREISTAVFAIVLFSLLTACGGGTNTPNTAQVNSNTAVNNSNTLDTVKATPAAKTNDAPTLTPVFKAYCEAKIKNDDAALRKVYSSDTIRSFEADMKSEKIKSLAEYLKDDRVSEKLCEISNEKIEGDRATALTKTDSYPNGIEVVFQKENGEWKMTNKSPTFDAVKPSNSNTSPKAK